MHTTAALQLSKDAARCDAPVPASISDVARLDDRQLCDWMANHRQLDGSVELQLDGWDKLPTEARSQLARRLTQDLGFELDLDYLNRRVCQLSDSRDALLPTVLERATREQTADTDSQTQAGEDDSAIAETDAYHRLVGDGGRPLYSIDSLGRVLQNPDEYQEMLRPFWSHPRSTHSANHVFQKQRDRWRDFRSWQLDNRGLSDPADAFDAHVREYRDMLKKYGFLQELAKLDSDPSYLKRPGGPWAYHEKRRHWQRRHQIEPGCSGFDDYKTAFGARLSRHGHLLSDLQLKENPRQQDALTTWAEYLCFEYWWHDYYLARLRHLKPEYDRACARLHDRGILQPGQDGDLVETDAYRLRLCGELKSTSAALTAARSEVERACQPRGTATSAPHQIWTGRLRKSDLKMPNRPGGTRAYRKSQGDVAKHPILIEWVQNQLLLIQTEMISATRQPPRRSKSKRRLAGDDLESQTANKYAAVEAAPAEPPHTSTTPAVVPQRRILRARNTKQLGNDEPLDTANAVQRLRRVLAGPARALRRSARIQARKMSADAGDATAPSRNSVHPGRIQR
ncbi:hypothetical protein BM221_006072 [Beauveria bassiana]|uniref:Ankyrin 2,3/unc44 n=1 Tax=Beauveria bassiana TaxID=176275 RepID=A0A2N6NKW1_BEABA|nr:hypothetical protein BM221_006072 [Beauveria bassiana]